MLPHDKRAPQQTSPVSLGGWLFLIGVPLVWCAHAYALWSGTLSFLLTGMVLWFGFLAVLRGQDAAYRRAQWVVGLLLVFSLIS